MSKEGNIRQERTKNSFKMENVSSYSLTRNRIMNCYTVHLRFSGDQPSSSGCFSLNFGFFNRVDLSVPDHRLSLYFDTGML